MKLLVIEMGIGHVQGFWVQSCWPVLLRLICAPCSYQEPMNPSQKTWSPRKSFWFCEVGIHVCNIWFCWRHCEVFSLLFFNIGCYWYCWFILISTKEQIEKTKAVCNSCWERSGMVLHEQHGAVLWWQWGALFPLEMAHQVLGRHLAQATLSLLTWAVVLQQPLWNTEQSISWEPPTLPLHGKPCGQQGWHTQQWGCSCSGEKPQKNIQ